MNSSVITSHLHTSFRKIGAFVQALPVPTGSRRAPGGARRRITVRDRTFELTLAPHTLAVVSDCRPDERHLVLSLQNSGGKPHVVDELVRSTGETVWHHVRHAPNGFTDAQRADLPSEIRRESGWSRRMRVLREGSALARGAVRHLHRQSVARPAQFGTRVPNRVAALKLGALAKRADADVRIRREVFIDPGTVVGAVAKQQDVLVDEPAGIVPIRIPDGDACRPANAETARTKTAARPTASDFVVAEKLSRRTSW